MRTKKGKLLIKNNAKRFIRLRHDPNYAIQNDAIQNDTNLNDAIQNDAILNCFTRNILLQLQQMDSEQYTS